MVKLYKHTANAIKVTEVSGITRNGPSPLGYTVNYIQWGVGGRTSLGNEG